MNINIKRLCLTSTLFLGATASLQASQLIQAPFDYPRILDWVAAPNNQFNICNGYYREHTIPYTPNPLIPSQINSYDVTADHVTYSATGTSILEGHVRITQPDQELMADRIYLDRNPTTGKVEVARAYGNVRLFESGKLLVGKYGRMNLVDHTTYLETTAYHMEATNFDQGVKSQNSQTGEVEYQRYGLNYWGHAKTITQTQPHRFVLKDSTYTTCPPSNKNCAWHLTATTVNLNRDQGVGHAWNSLLWVKSLPVFYFPYISFPLNHERKTGFLMPLYSHTTNYGLGFSFPFYWNMAPNYDTIITPRYMSKRGFMLSDLFRYITHSGFGNGTVGWVPNDREFAHFKKESAQNVDYEVNHPQALAALENDSTTRYSIDWLAKQQLNDHVTGNIQFQKISDDYYNKDLGKSILNNSSNQLLQEGDLTYLGRAWNFSGTVSHYQTLHPINQQQVQNQYSNLPSVSVGYSLPAIPGSDLTAGIGMNDIQFYEAPTPDWNNKPEEGNRLVVNPSIGYSMNAPFGSLSPQLQVQMLKYHARQLPLGVSSTASSVIPTFSMNGVLYFNRYFNLLDTMYRQTLEPQLFYVYVPYVNQNDQPIFDHIGGHPFTYNYLFSTNRFSMTDRVGDMNQLTGAVTTRFINAETGDTLGFISAGEILYLAREKGGICQGVGCTTEKPNPNLLSPIVVHGEYYFLDKLTALTDLTWQQDGRTLNDTLNIKYRDAGKVLNVNYAISKSGMFTNPSTLTQPNARATLNSLDLSGQYLIKRHVDLFGRWNYAWTGNATKDHGSAYLAGLEYTACCWAVRFVATRTYIGNNPGSLTQYENQYYAQVDLKGLGAFGNEDASGALYDNIPGFQNDFDQMVGATSTA